MTTNVVGSGRRVERPSIRHKRPVGGRKGRGSRIAYQLGAIAIMLALWQGAVASGILSASAVASPSSIVAATASVFQGPAFGAAVENTFVSWAEGLFVSLAVAIPLGVLLGTSALAYRMSRFSIDFLRTIPPVALIPLALLVYGATSKMVFLLVVFGSVWIVLLQSMYGVHQVDPAVLEVARAYRLRRRDRVFRVILPSAAPFVATGIRLAATVCLLLAIGGELIGGAPGVGNQITLLEQAGDISQMWVYIVLTAGFGVIVNIVMLRIERKALKWHSAQRSVVTL